MENFFSKGRMISGTKTAPKGHVCVFNGNICIKSKGKIWFGDLDITADAKRLAEYAKEVGETLYILREKDAPDISPCDMYGELCYKKGWAASRTTRTYACHSRPVAIS